MYNSVIVAYRDRPQCLSIFLRSVENALKNVNKNSVEIIITELRHDDVRTKPIIDEYKNKINIKHFPIHYVGNFWKTKALNHSARFSEGEIITMVDVDSIVPPVFFAAIEQFFKKHNNSRLSHRVRFLDDKASNWFYSHEKFNDNEFNNICVAKASNHKIAKERYTVSNLQTNELNPASTRGAPMNFKQTQVLGNSHFSMQKTHYMEIGGYDERFIGYGCEDLDFNVRTIRHLRQARMNLQPSHTIYHLSHAYEKSVWKDKGLLDLNRQRYKKNRKTNLIKYPINSQWGRFS